MSMPTRSTVFLSYSHQDEDWKNRVVGHLDVLEAELDVWDDRRIAKGDAWLLEIQDAMDRAAVAVLLISKDFLNSKFIKGTEVPHLLKRRREDGLRVIPLFVHSCAWPAVKWLADIQGGPKDAKPLAEHRKPQAEKILADLALEIQGWLREPLTPRPPLPSHSPRPGEGEPGSDELAKPGPHA
ncbi:MAG TPA: toll/interleukin-1 receptor domain-containing protein, partial [Thermoanaerobaculia bacterium]|nr:toll/interleukin-1 receptor domain-containing protein [Thermoanaerobaculia bacterium]